MEFTSSVVKYEDFLTDDFRRIASELNEDYKIHRKLWEFVRICQIAESYMDLNNAKVLGFGVGREPIAAWFASKGAVVTATDLVSTEWKESHNQNSSSKDDLRWEGICTREQFDNNVTFLNVDMNHIPAGLKLQQFDIVYSAGSFEHIGSKVNSLWFLVNQLQCLKPSGLAIHITEYAYDSYGYEASDICTFSVGDLASFANSIENANGRMFDLDLSLGDDEADKFVDRPPYGKEPHLKLWSGCNTTSVCLVISKVGIVEELSPNKKRNILWVGDAVVDTGFARCTHNVCDALVDDGHRVSVLGINYYGDPHDYKYNIYPCVHPFEGGNDAFGCGRLESLAKKLKADTIVFLNDPWNIPGYLDNLSYYVKSKCNLVAWLAVDGENQKAERLNELDRVIVWTEFAAEELKLGGYNGPCGVVPLGVDTSIFRPVGQDERKVFRSIVNSTVTKDPVSENAYIVGVVGRNQYPRKRLDLAISYFSDWVHSYDAPDAYLMMYTSPTGERGYDIYSLAKRFNILDRLIVVLPQNGNIGKGASDEQVSAIFNCMDLYITTSQGEGWGLPALEAMACGVPVIAPKWSGLASWADDVATLVPCYSHTEVTAPVNGMMHTLGGIPDRIEFVDAMNYLYTTWQVKDTAETYYQDSIVKGLQLASKLSWQNTQSLFLAELENVYQL